MYKLIISIDDDGKVDVTHEGSVNEIYLLGVLRKAEHAILNGNQEPITEEENGTS